MAIYNNRMAERKKSPIEKDLGQKKSLYKKEDKVKNRAAEAKKIPQYRSE